MVEGETGLLVDIDDPSALENAVEKLIDSCPLRQTFGAAAERRIAERYDAERLIEEHLKLYRKLLN